MKTKEIMTTKVMSVKPDDFAGEALSRLFRLKISGLPVIDEKGKLVGMFTEKEILTKVLPSYVEKVGIFRYEENPKAIKQKVIALASLKVKDIMRKDVVVVDEDTTLCEAAHLMLSQKVRRLPVLNASKEIVGIVARVDVVKALFEEYK
ncbi:MAG: CBS domain-containing protein [Candidatus Omnitrophota bacterium]